MNVHVAQINIGTMIAPTDDPAVSEFMDNLDRINAQADEAPGFVWRLQTEEGNATSIHVFPDPLELVNMSVWESVEHLKTYVYRTDHVDFFRRRARWFERDAKRVALWHVSAGTIPELHDAVRRVEFLERHGPSPYAFGFAQPPKPLVIERTSPDDPRTRDLMDRLNAELEGLYDHPDANHFSLDAAEVADGRGAMVLAIYDGEAVGCGALRKLDDARAEVKRMFVDPSVRGAKIGAAVLDRLEATAPELGCYEVVLETGVQQLAAIETYRKAGYERTELWGEYLASPDTSIAYRKPVAPPA